MSAAIFQNMYQVDGTTNSASTIGHDQSFELQSGTFRLNITPEDILLGRRGLLSKDSAGYDDGGHFGIFIVGDALLVRVQDTASSLELVANDVFTAGEATEVVVTFGDEGLHVYADGAEVASAPENTQGIEANQEPIVIGANQWASGDGVADHIIEPFNGTIEFSLEKGQQKPDTLDDQQNQVELPVVDETPEPVVDPVEEPVVDETPEPVVDPVEEPAAPVFHAEGLSFNGTTGSAVVMAHDATQELESGLFEVKFSVDSTYGRQTLISKDSGGYDNGGHMGVFIDGDDVIVRMQDTDSQVELTVADVIEAGADHHLAFTFGDGGLTVYLDGQEVASDATWTHGLQGNAEPIVLGANQWASGDGVADYLLHPLNGEISAVNLYDETVSIDDINFDASTETPVVDEPVVEEPVVDETPEPVVDPVEDPVVDETPEPVVDPVNSYSENVTLINPNVQVIDSDLFQLSDLNYLGSFRVPKGTVGEGTFDYGGKTLAFNPENNSLFIGGFEHAKTIAEIEIPDLIVNSEDKSDLMTANILQELSGHVFDDIPDMAGVNGVNGSRLDDLMVVDGQLIGTVYSYYDAAYEATASHFVYDSLDLDAGNTNGLYAFEGVNPGVVGGYMAEVPEEFRSALGDVTHITGQNGIAIVGRSGAGPTAVGFNAEDLLNGNNVTEYTPYAYYDHNDVIGGQWDENNAFGLNGVTKVDGVVFAPDTDSVLFFGRIAGSGTTYGTGEEANDPYVSYKGYHATDGDYQSAIWAYDVDDYIKVTNGELDAGKIEPYAHWTFEMPHSETGTHLIGGTAYDAETGKLYVSMYGADAEGFGYLPLINVFDLKGDVSDSSNEAVYVGLEGQDIFDFDNLQSEAVTIENFDLSEGDALDVSGILEGYDPLQDQLDQFIQVTDNGVDTFVSVDVNGGGDDYVQIATLDKVIGLTDTISIETSAHIIVL